MKIKTGIVALGGLALLAASCSPTRAPPAPIPAPSSTPAPFLSPSISKHVDPTCPDEPLIESMYAQMEKITYISPGVLPYHAFRDFLCSNPRADMDNLLAGIRQREIEVFPALEMDEETYAGRYFGFRACGGVREECIAQSASGIYHLLAPQYADFDQKLRAPLEISIVVADLPSNIAGQVQGTRMDLDLYQYNASHLFMVVAHEGAHLAGVPGGDGEVRTQLVAFEMAAREARSGNIIAEYGLLNELEFVMLFPHRSAINLLMGDQRIPEISPLRDIIIYQTAPFIEAMNDVRSESPRYPALSAYLGMLMAKN